MGVLLKERILKDKSSKSLFLDINHNGKRKVEWLNIIIKPGSDPLIKSENKEKIRIAQEIRNKREMAILRDQFEFDKPIKVNDNFIEFYQTFIDNLTIINVKADKCVLKKLKEFNKGKPLAFSELTEHYLRRFREHLNKELSDESTYDYFKKLKRVIALAEKQDLVRRNHAANIPNKRGVEGIAKEVLTIEELTRLRKALCSNDEVKRGFLFCCMTGLRYCDVSILKWAHIKGGAIDIKQKKTQIPVYINLNNDAIKLIGEKGDPEELVFKLPSHTSCLDILRTWTKEAEIDKHITWHCGRHSFGTNLVGNGIDLATASALLGHTSYDYTQRYVRINAKMKETAVSKLPSIF